MEEDPKKDLERHHHSVVIGLLEKLANSDLKITPKEDASNLVYVIGAGCLFVGPEENYFLNLDIYFNRPGALYAIKEIRQETYDNSMFLRLSGVRDWNYEIHRCNSSFPPFPGKAEIPFEFYEKYAKIVVRCINSKP